MLTVMLICYPVRLFALSKFRSVNDIEILNCNCFYSAFVSTQSAYNSESWCVGLYLCVFLWVCIFVCVLGEWEGGCQYITAHTILKAVLKFSVMFPWAHRKQQQLFSFLFDIPNETTVLNQNWRGVLLLPPISLVSQSAYRRLDNFGGVDSRCRPKKMHWD